MALIIVNVYNFSARLIIVFFNFFAQQHSCGISYTAKVLIFFVKWCKFTLIFFYLHRFNVQINFNFRTCFF